MSLLDYEPKIPKYQNFTFFPFLTKIDPPSTKKEIGFLYTLVGSHMQNFNLISPGRVDLAWLQAKYQICPFLAQKWPPSEKIMNRVPLHTVRNPHARNFSFIGPDSIEFAWLQAKNPQKYQNFTFSPFLTKIDPPSTTKEIGFLYTLVGSHMQNFYLIRPGRVDLAWLQAKYQICPFLPKNDPAYAPKWSALRRSSQESHTPNFRLIGPDTVEWKASVTDIHTHTHTHIHTYTHTHTHTHTHANPT